MLPVFAIKINIGSMAKISVIIPVYGVEKYLNRCVESVVNQTYKNIEIILIYLKLFLMKKIVDRLSNNGKKV